MSRVRLSETTVKLPFLGIDTKWTLSREEQNAAWKLLVQLVTQNAVTQQSDHHGSDLQTMESLTSLFGIVRQILSDHGVDTAPSRGDGTIPFATVAVRILNDVVSPLTAKWGPLLEKHHAERPANRGIADWEQSSWGGPGAPYHYGFRSELFAVRAKLRTYIFVLARAAKTVEFGSAVESDARRSALNTGAVRLWKSPEAASAPPVRPKPGLAARFTQVRHRWATRPKRRMTRWFDPLQLLKIIRRQIVKSDDRENGPYSECKEWFDESKNPNGSKRNELWFDYVADLGDAFDPTMQVAWTLGRAKLGLQPTSSPRNRLPLPRGDLLIMGGDEVYPYGSTARYRRQLRLPYDHAFEDPEADEHKKPSVFALPGNHDWYGGLAAWRNVFCGHTSRAFGGWKTQQNASWWAIKLPHGWWLWGLDTGLDGKINQAQHDYFEAAANELAEGDQVILCTPVPLWRLRETRPERLAELERFVGRHMRRTAVARVYLAGDSHVFAAYRRHRTSGKEEFHITSGGGGAFLQPTHNLSPIVPAGEIDHPNDAMVDSAPFVEGTFWPPPSSTYLRTVRQLGRALRDRQSVTLGLLVGSVHSLYSLLTGSHARSFANKTAPAAAKNGPLGLRWIWHQVSSGVRIDRGSALTVAIATGVVIAICRWGVARPNTAETAVKRGARRAGTWHGAAQATTFAVTAIAAHRIIWAWRHTWHSPSTPWVLLLSGVLGAAGSIAVSMGFLLRVNRRLRVNDNEAFSARHARDGKHFLRCHIDERGRLHVFLIALERIETHWAKWVRNASEREAPAAPRVTAWMEWSAVIPPYVEPVEFTPLANRRVAVSISEPDLDPDPEVNKTRKKELDHLFMLLVETLLAAGFEVAYGGDHRKSGFVQRLADAGGSGAGVTGRLVNYLTASELAGTKILIPGVSIVTVSVAYEDREFLTASSVEIHRCRELTAMRERMTEECIARVVIGGKLLGAAGAAPGVLEEAHLSKEAGKALIVVGAYGGVGQVIADATRWSIDHKTIADLQNDAGYSRRLNVLQSTSAVDMLRGFWGLDLADGLTLEERKLLRNKKDPHAIARLILSSLRAMAEKENSSLRVLP